MNLKVECELDAAEDNNEMLAITAHLILGSEKWRWMEQSKLLSSSKE